ncbi:uncharacterized protein NFIA_077200 [Aspergillus fischeri NRRL 181]|uniref:F-box domain protein n=1 Tax=Neosartorya fischeri (strain ATCC 1020 / DSM 3700 / CBS 544.65 / FGSC A1164 / JCM 1740 / NRRL 181 / WB 181) TaxID=331117 RepID=A1DEI0_NEOFI|nr:F-box domain protein [Aspergillus fischeri NRRL 181]EAW17787.1 F-box domain protein [Aspergillus fischeri NRRL 181]KAG2012663.1 hypothetical protein GB937_007012 [Aspergillus fischeri]
MADASLETLPVELLNQISSYLSSLRCGKYPYSVSQKHLSRLSRTCRRLRDVCQPLLFEYYYHSSKSLTPLLSFLRTLDARPDLAKCVTSLDFHGQGQADTLSDGDRQLVESCIAKFGLPPLPADWQDCLGVERRLLAAELVVASCPNIEVLKLPMNPEWMVSVLDSLPKDFVFAKLRKLDVWLYYISGDHYGIGYQKISGLLHASPNLEHLSLPSIETFYPGEAGVPILEKVGQLDLGEGAPSPYFLKCALEACPNLQRFELHWIDSDGYDQDSEEWSPLDGWRALQRVQSSVREIIFETIIEFRDDDNLEDGVSTLCDFPHLEILKVNGIALQALYKVWTHHSRHGTVEQFVYQVFPSTIKELTIWDPDASLIEAVRFLAREAVREQYPHLARITISRSGHLSGHRFDVAQWARREATVRREFERSSIELCMDLPSVPDYPDFPYVFR